MKPAILLILAAALTGCVTIPIPPFGERVGELGDLKVSIAVQYIPKTNPLQSTTATEHAFRKLVESTRTLKDKK